MLQQRNINQALISAGGDTDSWEIVPDVPGTSVRQAMVAVLPLDDTAISTSGDYERYFEAAGVSHHHIISPATGRSARAVQSVTIIGPNATLTDTLSTSVFVMGPAAGLELINTRPELEAVIIDRHGRMLYSKGLDDVKPATTAHTKSE